MLRALKKNSTVIESLGTYLPARQVRTEELVAACSGVNEYPLERLTGIRSRRVGGDGEYGIDYARRAISDCLTRSHWDHDAIDLLLCCNISRYDATNMLRCEPSTAAILKAEFELRGALALDLSNACAGTFTAIHVAETLLSTGEFRNALIVSGEHTTFLTETAVREIADHEDPRMACLTLGDSGIAVMLERRSDEEAGFKDLELMTLGSHWGFCIGSVSEQPRGGFIMKTDSIPLAREATHLAIHHSRRLLDRMGWSLSDLQHLIVHQTSRASIVGAKRMYAQVFGKQAVEEVNFVDNVSCRGNTATTSHFIALMDQIRAGNVNSGDRVLFGIAASGIVVGNAVYQLDDLPDRIRNQSADVVVETERPVAANQEPQTAFAQSSTGPATRRDPAPELKHCHVHRTDQPQSRSDSFATFNIQPGVIVESVGLADTCDCKTAETKSLALVAARRCLERSSFDRGEIDQVIFAGVYRSEFLFEPAVAAIIAGELGIGAVEHVEHSPALGFDMHNGAMSQLAACFVGSQMIASGSCRRVLVVTSEVEPVSGNTSALNIAETGTAMILVGSSNPECGFDRFVFGDFSARGPMFQSAARFRNGQPYLEVSRDPQQGSEYLARCVEATEHLLNAQGIGAADVAKFVPAQLSSAFISGFAEKMGLSHHDVVDATRCDADLYTASLPVGFASLQQTLDRGDLAAFVTVGAGVQVGCATYRF